MLFKIKEYLVGEESESNIELDRWEGSSGGAKDNKYTFGRDQHKIYILPMRSMKKNASRIISWGEHIFVGQENDVEIGKKK